MEEYERHTLSHYPFKDEARKDVIRKLAKLSVLSDKYISEGNTKDATAYLQSYNTLMKELGIGNEIIVPSSNIGLTIPPFAESKPFLLNIIFICKPFSNTYFILQGTPAHIETVQHLVD